MSGQVRKFALVIALIALVIAPAAMAQRGRATVTAPSPTTVTYSGQGLLADGFGGYDLVTELCGMSNGADAEGPYLLWVLTATRSNTASITGPWGTAPMVKFGNGTFKYVSGWYDPDTLPGNVTATYNKPKNAQLTVSHGCRPFNNGAWCSPGFWHNATDDAWALTGYAKESLFNDAVYDYWFGGTFLANPTLYTVVNDASTYSGPPFAGTSGYALNAFNATGAMLTDSIPGYEFNWDVMKAGSSDACPIDHFGHYKVPQQ